MKKDGASSYTIIEPGVTCHFNQELPDLGPFPRAWGTLAYINAHSKYAPLQCRTFEQFDAQVFHRASLSGGFVLQQVRDNKPAKS